MAWSCKFCFFELKLIYNAVLISGIQQIDSFVYEHIYFTYVDFIFFSIMVYHKILYNSLCYTGPCCLSCKIFLKLFHFLKNYPVSF